MMGQGVSSRSSHSRPAGRTTFSANSWTHFWICNWSSFRASEKSDMVILLEPAVGPASVSNDTHALGAAPDAVRAGPDHSSVTTQ